ncbi:MULTISPECIES: SpoIIE family protein phosphatase [unclassified Thiocapsa]|uniref:SpoIIE family protein phosphatase n=1 Tax=unclassified Thiocapsa TaxID=2641286 RepID=UPI0035B31291
MIQVDVGDLDRLTEASYRILRGEKPPLLELPPEYPANEFRQFVEYFNRLIGEYTLFADFMYAMARGELDYEPPASKMRVVQSFKSLQANLRHLTWKTQQIAAGDLTQRVDFMGDFSAAFNEMTRQLEQAFADLSVEKERSDQLLLRVTDSIQYAQRIQSALLPGDAAFAPAQVDGFSIWLPRDIVGGDIFCVETCPAGVLVALLDCTGHGVPGALMSMLAVAGLRRLIQDEACHAPADLLHGMNDWVKTTLRQETDASPSDDGLDAAICLLRPDAGELIFAGAHLPLYRVRDGAVDVVRGDRPSLGYKRSRSDVVFTSHSLPLEPGSVFYLCSDGLLDQPGDPGGLPLGRSGFTRIVEAVWDQPLATQRAQIEAAFLAHAGEHERRDDVTVLGWRALG